MFIPMWLIYVTVGLVIAYVWSLHRERARLKEALEESQEELEELQDESDVDED